MHKKAATKNQAMAQSIKSDGTTVSQMRNRLKNDMKIDFKKLNTFKRIPRNQLKEVMGEPMIQSLVEFFVTADICEVSKEVI